MLKEKLAKLFYKYKIILLILIILIIGIYIIFNNINEKQEVIIEEDINLINKEEPIKEELKYYYVDIKGAVFNPNVYKIASDCRVIDAIKMAGGFNKDADTSILNLSKKITDEMTIIIYTKKQIEKFKAMSSNINDVITEDIKCPDPDTNDACINNETSTSNKVSINTASLTELQTLSGIGEAKAKDIIEYRNTNGLFTKIEDIQNVKGIGESVFAKIKENITL
ncbi:MAG: helix-hairpin-helix domain-containing protein [Bacilli bacterium]|nr:helix-hairpin-helix domain-containing protein [Bacilli bacterium]